MSPGVGSQVVTQEYDLSSLTDCRSDFVSLALISVSPFHHVPDCRKRTGNISHLVQSERDCIQTLPSKQRPGYMRLIWLLQIWLWQVLAGFEYIYSLDFKSELFSCPRLAPDGLSVVIVPWPSSAKRCSWNHDTAQFYPVNFANDMYSHGSEYSANEGIFTCRSPQESHVRICELANSLASFQLHNGSLTYSDWTFSWWPPNFSDNTKTQYLSLTSVPAICTLRIWVIDTQLWRLYKVGVLFLPHWPENMGHGRSHR